MEHVTERDALSELDGYGDSYEGVTITQRNYGDISPEVFHKRLALSLETWTRRGKRGIWLEIPIARSNLIPIATELGFRFHHALERYVMLTKWLPTDQPNHLPTFATHCTGAVGFVVNDKHEVLLVQKGVHSSGPHLWKYPEGVANLGEHIGQTCTRVTLEETGINTEFVAPLTIRHTHNYRFGADGIFFTCLLRPLNTGVTMDTTEIAATKWINVDEYIADPSTTPVDRMAAEAYRDGLNQGWSIHTHYYHGNSHAAYRAQRMESKVSSEN